MLIKYLICMDGFDIERTFYPKEVSILNRLDAESILTTSHYRLDDATVGPSSSSLSPATRKHIRYATRFVHGLSFVERSSSDKSYGSLLRELRRMVEDATIHGWYVGYKGGTHVRDLFARMGCARNLINIELIGCPTFARIREIYPEIVDACPPCERHVACSSRRMCSRVKVFAYGVWLSARDQKNYIR